MHAVSQQIGRIFLGMMALVGPTAGACQVDKLVDPTSEMGRLAATAIARVSDGAVRAIFQNRRMLKIRARPVSDEERTTLWAQMEAGGEEFSANGGNSTPPPLPPLAPNYESIKIHILEKKCVHCHSPGGKAERVPLLTRSDLVDSPYDIVVPGDASQSEIVKVLSPGASKPMPPVDSGISPVSSTELEVIRAWINAGANDGVGYFKSNFVWNQDFEN